MPPGKAHFYDGTSARRYDVAVALAGAMTLRIEGDALPARLHWSLGDLRAQRDSGAVETLTLLLHTEEDDETGHDPARLVLSDPDQIAWITKAHPDLFRVDLRPGTFRKIGLYTGGAVLALGLMLFVILPALAGTLARIIPIDREIAFGKTVVAQVERFLGGTRLGGLRCEDPAGLAALDRLLARLTDGQDLAYVIEVQVFDHGLVNALAAPGGQVVLLRGLLDEATGPDAVAGVLAHEIAHVEARDATRGALRAAGSAGLLSMVIGDVTGGAALTLVAEHVVSASYTRQAEAAADVFALALLQDAGVSAEGFASFFEALDDEDGIALPEYLSTHPVTRDRASRARQVANAQTATQPILPPEDWAALQGICG